MRLFKNESINRENYMMTPALMKVRCNRILVSLVGEALVDKWWSSSNLAFEGLTPCKQWEKDPLVVYKYLLKNIDYGW